MRKYKVTAFYPTYAGLHPLDDVPNSRSTIVEADDERRAAVAAVLRRRLPVAFAERGSGEKVAIFWHPGMYGTDGEPEVAEAAPPEVVLKFGTSPATPRLTLSIFPDDGNGGETDPATLSSLPF
jgi:hypothetical protein